MQSTKKAKTTKKAAKKAAKTSAAETPEKKEKKTTSSKPGKKTQRVNVPAILDGLEELYPAPKCALEHKDPLQLLVATILSAQCTDERVNIVTKTLFQKYKTAADFAKATQEEMEKEIHSTGFFRNKAKNIRAMAQMVLEEHKGKVPKTMDELTALPGVARKTANVVLGTAFNIADGVVVDTHVHRLSNRMGLSAEKTPEKIERDLMELVPREKWIDVSHQLIWHGRKVCSARKPLCEKCIIDPHCQKNGVG